MKNLTLITVIAEMHDDSNLLKMIVSDVTNLYILVLLLDKSEDVKLWNIPGVMNPDSLETIYGWKSSEKIWTKYDSQLQENIVKYDTRKQFQKNHLKLI